MRGLEDVSKLAVAAVLAMSLAGAGCSSEESVDAAPPTLQQPEQAPGAPGAPAQQQDEEEEK